MTPTPTPPPSDYILKRDYLAAARLNYLHFLVKSQLGYSLHPSIPAQPDHGLRIADVGCGTCVFAIDLAKDLPKSEIHAFDISPDQFPPSEWLPPNVKCHVQDALAPFPAQLHGTFDIVSIKFLVSVVPGNPKSLLDNIVKLLKSGGYLQWIDANPFTYSIKKADPSLACAATEQAVAFVTRPQYSWINRLDEYFPKSGLTPITQPSLLYSSPVRESWTMWTQMAIMAFDEILERAASGVSKEQLANLVSISDGTKREAQSGVAHVFDMVVVIGKVETT